MSLVATPVQVESVPTSATVRFVLRALAWSLGLFALLRTSWVERHVLLPLTELQSRIADWYGGTAALPIVVSTECSGADAIALLLGAILAYPARWRARLLAAAGGLLLVLAANTVRIGTLALAVQSPRLFGVLHLYVWPAALVLLTGGYALAWMGTAGRPDRPRAGTDRPLRRFAVLAAGLLLASAAAAPWLEASRPVLGLAASMAGTAAIVLSGLGVTATATGPLLSTAGGSFLVTPVCVTTPLVPVYLAAALTLPRTRTRRGLALAATGPLFGALGIARILVVALPPSIVGAPLIAVHGFYQLLLGALAVGAATRWVDPGASTAASGALRRTLAACALGVGLLWALGGTYRHVVAGAIERLRPWALDLPPATAPLQDPQGALGLLPGYQLALLAALAVAAGAARQWRGLAGGLALLAASHVLLGLATDAAARHGLTPHPLGVRAWAIAGPILVLVALDRRARARHEAGTPPPREAETAPRPLPV
jgi:exosortase/archaeosortase family protein